MSKRYQFSISRYLDDTETDITLRFLNWCVDVYLVMDQLPNALAAKWARANYLLGVSKE